MADRSREECPLDQDFDPTALRDWRKNPDGAVFWREIELMKEDGTMDMRDAIKKGQLADAARFQGHVETLEEILNLVSILIDNRKKDIEAQRMESKE